MPLTYDEEELLLQVAAGDELAFTKLFHHWQPFLATHIYRITESKILTDEILQDVFLKIWQSRETLSTVRNFKSFLLVISKNHSLNVIQKKARDLRKLKIYLNETTLNSESVYSNDTEDTYHTLIDEAIDRLYPRQRKVYLLHKHERLTYNQIAEKLSIGRETVKTHLEHAVASISKYVKSNFSFLTIIFLLIS